MSREGIFRVILVVAFLTAVAAIVALGYVRYDADYQLSDQFPFIVSVTPTPTVTPTPRPTPTPTPTPEPLTDLEESARRIEGFREDNRWVDVTWIERTGTESANLLFFWVLMNGGENWPTEVVNEFLATVYAESELLLDEEQAVFIFVMQEIAPFEFGIAYQFYWFVEDMAFVGQEIDGEVMGWPNIVYFENVGQRMHPDERLSWYGIGYP